MLRHACGWNDETCSRTIWRFGICAGVCFAIKSAYLILGHLIFLCIFLIWWKVELIAWRRIKQMTRGPVTSALTGWLWFSGAKQNNKTQFIQRMFDTRCLMLDLNHWLPRCMASHGDVCYSKPLHWLFQRVLPYVYFRFICFSLWQRPVCPEALNWRPTRFQSMLQGCPSCFLLKLPFIQ